VHFERFGLMIRIRIVLDPGSRFAALAAPRPLGRDDRCGDGAIEADFVPF
jgi:hypothetical protein